ncbi:MAG: hypothetical protein KAK00_00415 [Nanoarchaeota archaeon]|nr:hypothetical protein [Nanoarchaeota archaeon]
MDKIVTEDDFKKTIKFEWLARTDSSQKFMLKSYLNILLAGGKITKLCRAYIVDRIDKSSINPAFFSEPNQRLKNEEDIIPEVKDGISALISQFIDMLRKREWTTETSQIEEFDENNNIIDYQSVDETKTVIVSKRVTTTIKTEYFIDDSLTIEELKLK